MEKSVIEWPELLLQLGLAVRQRLIDAHCTPSEQFAQPVCREGGDTIYGIDRYVEPVIHEVINSWPPACKPLLLVAEGMGGDGRTHIGPTQQPPVYRLIVDPIDGTRSLMFDKRSAWFIAAVAEDRGEATTLRDTFAAALVELPTSKQGWVDAITAERGRGALAQRSRIDNTCAENLMLRPSQALSLRHGFGQVTSFFPGTKVLAAELMERIAASTLGEIQVGEASVFDDQYISTGGQMVELMVGHDRFCCDLRPLFYEILRRDSRAAGSPVSIPEGLVCHPYDAAGALIADEAGVIITDGWGRKLSSPLDVHTPVHWCGYANESLRSAIEPIIHTWLRDRGLEQGF